MGNGIQTCAGTTTSGATCRRKPLKDSRYCGLKAHQDQGKGEVKAKAKGKGKRKGKAALARKGGGDVAAAIELLERTDWENISYYERLKAFRLVHDLWSNEDILAAAQMEIEMLGADPANSGKRSGWISQAIAAQKLIAAGADDGRRPIQVVIKRAPPSGDRPKP